MGYKTHTEALFEFVDDPDRARRAGMVGNIYEMYADLAYIRKQSRISQADLAKQAGITQAMLGC